jgi:hypothetical protein
MNKRPRRGAQTFRPPEKKGEKAKRKIDNWGKSLRPTLRVQRAADRQCCQQSPRCERFDQRMEKGAAPGGVLPAIAAGKKDVSVKNGDLRTLAKPLK